MVFVREHSSPSQKITEAVIVANPDLSEFGELVKTSKSVVEGETTWDKIEMMIRDSQLEPREDFQQSWEQDQRLLLSACNAEGLGKVIKAVNDEAGILEAQDNQVQQIDWIGTVAALVFPDNDRHRQALAWIMFNEGYRYDSPNVNFAEMVSLQYPLDSMKGMKRNLQNDILAELPLIDGQHSLLTRAMMIMAYLHQQPQANQDLAVEYMERLKQNDPGLSLEKKSEPEPEKVEEKPVQKKPKRKPRKKKKEEVEKKPPKKKPKKVEEQEENKEPKPELPAWLLALDTDEKDEKETIEKEEKPENEESKTEDSDSLDLGKVY